MKIEMDNNSSFVVATALIITGIVAIALIVYKYNVAAFEQGYVQKQMEHSASTMWTKE